MKSCYRMSFRHTSLDCNIKQRRSIMYLALGFLTPVIGITCSFTYVVKCKVNNVLGVVIIYDCQSYVYG